MSSLSLLRASSNQFGAFDSSERSNCDLRNPPPLMLTHEAKDSDDKITKDAYPFGTLNDQAHGF